ncbi:MAG: hypothetical protein ACXV3F_11945 [Frankiaceae bacterium]
MWGPVATPPRAEDALADDAATILRVRARQSLTWLVGALRQPVDTVPAPSLVNAANGLSARSTARVALGRNQALVLTIRGAGARQIGVAIADPWGLPPVDALSRGINSTQARPNPDGTYTVVVSTADPGAVNWVDASHLPVGLVTVRWQGLPPRARANPPTLTGRPVDSAELGSMLPAGSLGVSAATRTLQRWGQAVADIRRTAEVIYTAPASPASPPAESVVPGSAGLSATTGLAGLSATTGLAALCPTGGQNPGGDRLTPQAECAQQQVRARFPFIEAVGGCCGNGGGQGDHPTGRAVDFTLTHSGTTSPAVRAEGELVVAWLIANQLPLHLKYIGWWQRIWYPDRGWRVECLPTFARCGLDGPPTVTSMHQDHVHLSVR